MANPDVPIAELRHSLSPGEFYDLWDQWMERTATGDDQGEESNETMNLPAIKQHCEQSKINTTDFSNSSTKGDEGVPYGGEEIPATVYSGGQYATAASRTDDQLLQDIFEDILNRLRRGESLIPDTDVNEDSPAVEPRHEVPQRSTIGSAALKQASARQPCDAAGPQHMPPTFRPFQGPYHPGPLPPSSTAYGGATAPQVPVFPSIQKDGPSVSHGPTFGPCYYPPLPTGTPNLQYIHQPLLLPYYSIPTTGQHHPYEQEPATWSSRVQGEKRKFTKVGCDVEDRESKKVKVGTEGQQMMQEENVSTLRAIRPRVDQQAEGQALHRENYTYQASSYGETTATAGTSSGTAQSSGAGLSTRPPQTEQSEAGIMAGRRRTSGWGKGRGKGPFKCPQCGKEFTRQMDVGRHAKSVHGHAAFKCDDCGRFLSRKDSLKAHKRSHERSSFKPRAPLVTKTMGERH